MDKKLQDEKFRKRWASLGMFAGPVTFLVLLFFSLLIHEWKMSEVGYTAVVGMAGIIFGWGVGFLLSPETFKNLSFSRPIVVIFAFIGGYFFSKIEPLLFFLFQEKILLEKPDYGIRFVIFLICLIISTINMYVYRIYLDDFARWMQYKPEENISEKPIVDETVSPS
jgi:hypothetical protein